MAKGGRRAHSGRKKTPTDMRLLQGTFRSDRHGNQVTVPAKWPDPPSHLSAREVELWNGLREHCEQWVAPSDWLTLNGVVSIADCVLRIQEAKRETETSGHPLAFKHIIEEANGKSIEVVEAKENPLYSLELKTWRELRAYIGLTGLSPVDRARVQRGAEPEAPVNPLAKFVNRKRG